MDKKLEKRMYGFVPYQLNGRQSGIQFGHAVVEYSLEYGLSEEYIDFAKNYKTFIMLDGGTTSYNPLSKGTMNQILDKLKELGLKVSEFREPDLGDQLTAFVFILDERFFNKTEYPLYEDRDEFTSSQHILKHYYRTEYDYNVGVFGSNENAEIAKIIRSSRLASN